MSRLLELEDFDATASPAVPAVGPVATAPGSAAADAADAAEVARTAGYEEGYKTGWDDAVRAAEADARNVGAELARNLRDLSFSYIEARDEVLSTLKPFLSELFETLFPALLPETVAAAIAAELAAGARDGIDGRMRLAVSPEDGPVVRRLLSDADVTTAEVEEEPALATGQARLRTGAREIEIDADAVLAQFRAALEADEPDDRRVGTHG